MPSSGDLDHCGDGRGFGLGPLPNEQPLQDRLVRGRPRQEDPQPPTAPTALGRQLGRLAHLAAVAADLLPEHIDVIDRRKGHREGAVGDDQALLLDRQEAGAPCLDADFSDDGVHQLQPPEQDVEPLAILEVPGVRPALVPARGLEDHRDHALLRRQDRKRGVEHGPVEINDLHRGSPSPAHNRVANRK
jgi:hypothetical protein